MNPIIKNYINYCLLNYPTIFPTVAHVLEHAFFVNGNGLLSEGFAHGFPKKMVIETKCFEALRKSCIEKANTNLINTKHSFGDYGVKRDIIDKKHAETMKFIMNAKEWIGFEKPLTNLVDEIFAWNFKHYGSRFKLPEDPTESYPYGHLCDGFPYGFPYIDFEGDLSYRYVPLANMKRAGMHEDLREVASSFLVGIVNAEHAKILETEHKGYKEYRMNRLDSFCKFKHWFDYQ